MKEQKIVVIRHAHRDKPTPDADNGLSEKGRDQTQDLVKAYEKGSLPKAKVFWSSPKVRCIETLEPIAKAAGGKVVIENLLDEQQSRESSKEFQGRVEKIMHKAADLNENVYLCSHGDLLPEAIDFLTGRSVAMDKGEALAITRQKSGWEL